MVALIVRRLGLGLLTLLVVSMLIFAGTEILPGDVATAVLGQSATPQTVAALRKALGLDIPAYLRYLRWLGNFLKGDLGVSLTNGRAVAAEIGERLGNTLFLAGFAAAIAVPLALALGIVSAIRRGGVLDRVANILSLAAISLPEFLIAYILIMILSVNLSLFPSLAMLFPGMTLGSQLSAIALPVLTLVLGVLAHMMRHTRTAVLAVMGAPYIEMAILKGLPTWRVVAQHAFPNALAPIISVVAFTLAYLIVGVIVVEVVFVYPGLGQLMVNAVSLRDVPVVQDCGMIFAATYVGLNTVADLLMVLTNPRLRHPR